jgi:hypothetical protein
MAIENGKYEISTMFIKIGTNLDLNDMNGNTSLMTAVRQHSACQRRACQDVHRTRSKYNIA